MAFTIRIALTACFWTALASGHASLEQGASAAVTISGDIPSTVALTAGDLAKMPREKISIPEKDGTKTEYEGVPLREILKRAGAPSGKDLRGKALATYVLAKARDGYRVVFTLAEVAPEFANEQILLADERDGKRMDANQGPFRLVCPNDKAGARSVRMLQAIEIVRLSR